MIYRSWDIRGKVGSELTPELYRYWGLALASMLSKNAKFLVSRDHRLSSIPFLTELVKGLQIGGASVVDIGPQPPSVIYYASRRIGAEGFASVTGAGMPEPMNGLRWLILDQPHYELRHIEVMKSKTEELMKKRPNLPELELPPPRTLDVTYDYVAWLQDTWFDTPLRSLKVTLDPMYGSWAFKARRYLQTVYQHIIVTAVHDRPVGSPGAWPENKDRLADVCNEVDFQHSDLGFVLDEDGERFGIIDRNGVPFRSSDIIRLMISLFGETLQNQPFVHDVFCPKLLIRELENEYNIRSYPVPCGTTYFYKGMLDTMAPFGAESSGRFYFRALCGGNDPLFTICWILDYLSRKEIDLAQWRTTVPEYFYTPITKIPFDFEGLGEEPERILKVLATAWPNAKVIDFDGISVELPQGWITARKSLTNEAIMLCVEGKSNKDKNELIALCCRALDLFGGLSQHLWHLWTD